MQTQQDKDDQDDASSSAFLNEDDAEMESLGDTGNYIPDIEMINVSSYALTDIFVSYPHSQSENSAVAAQQFMKHISEIYIQGDESKLDKLNLLSQDATASLSLRPVGLVLANTIQKMKN